MSKSNKRRRKDHEVQSSKDNINKLELKFASYDKEIDQAKRALKKLFELMNKFMEARAIKERDRWRYMKDKLESDQLS